MRRLHLNLFRSLRVFGVLVLMASGPSLAGQVVETKPATEQPRASALIEALGSENYTARIQARDGLMRLGRAAIEPLEAAILSEDSEVRLRAGEILIALRGRGFLGMSLEEVPAYPAHDPSPHAEGTEPVVVQVVQVLDYQQYEQYGVKRPFPAEEAGLQAGDKILMVNNRPIAGIRDVIREVTLIGPARLVVLLIERDGTLKRICAVATRNPVLQTRTNIGSDPPPPVDLEKELERRTDG